MTVARMTPWCIIAIDDEQVLFGFTSQHAETGGQSWSRSSPIQQLDAAAGVARTASGREYHLGRRIEPADIPSEGDEAWLAFDLLIGDHDLVPPFSADPAQDSKWLTTCKMARHLAVAPPGRAPAAVDEFLDRYKDAYLRLRYSTPATSF